MNEPKRCCENCAHRGTSGGTNPATGKAAIVCRLKAPSTICQSRPMPDGRSGVKMVYETFSWWPDVRLTDYCAEGYQPSAEALEEAVLRAAVAKGSNN